ncbi:MAG TPA: CDP-alcohol phosphatidyltransferase family protein [Opitutaceae bacterium]|jgi:phosphatidylglycerophosphate synthase
MSGADAWAGAALPAVAAVLLAVPGAGTHGRVAAEGGTAFLPGRIMDRGYRYIETAARAASGAGLSAAAVSWASLALGLASGALAALGLFGLAAWALALSGVLDGVDGAVARLRGTASPSGAVLDSVLDRYVEFFFLAGVVAAFRGVLWVQLLAVAALFGGFMVTYSTAKAQALRVVPPRGWMKRAERVAWLIAGSAAAGAAGLRGISPWVVLGPVLGVVALFANLSAIVRLRRLAAAAQS